MSVEKISKIKIAADSSKKEKILQLLSRSGYFEVVTADKAEPEDFTATDITGGEAIVATQAKLALTINYLNEINSEALFSNKKIKKGKLAVAPDENGNTLYDANKIKGSLARLAVNEDELAIIDKNESHLLAIADNLEKTKLERADIEKRIKELKEKSGQLEQFASVTVPFSSFSDTEYTSCFLCYNKSPIDIVFMSKYDCFIEDFNATCGGTLWGVVCKKEDKKTVLRKLNALEFTLCVYSDNKTAAQIIDETALEIDNLENQFSDSLRVALAFVDRLSEFKTLYDIYLVKQEWRDIEKHFYYDGDTINIEGYVPERFYDVIQNKLKQEIAGIEVTAIALEPLDTPPTLLRNNKVVAPFTGVTTGYAVPEVNRGIDPSPIMSIFFFIFFGMMLADAGYGLVMALVGFLAGKLIKFEKPVKRMIIMFAICGLAGILFGILFGGVFGIEPIQDIMVYSIPFTFAPLENPVAMLVLSLVLGAIHLLVGFTLKTIVTIKDSYKKTLTSGKKFKLIMHGLFDSIFMYALFAGVGLVAFPMAMEMVAPDVDISGLQNAIPFSTIALVLVIFALAGIVLTSGRRAPTIRGKFAGGFGGLYKLINLFSDVLSYSRLFGLALAGGAIAYAFNEIGLLLMGLLPPGIGHVVAGIILLVLHTFNLALSALAAYVSSIRLNYVEFFGKFYDVDGRAFAPLGEGTKYVVFK